ncbi:SgcJ/EcaC family oxidoreductase [Novosphingobium sp. 9U]|uniref:SgcJ/EcaC family oxidoreductase n=1 Tax=Novosphingobium sp. 9U TaxID=2653158 RepID=UPI0012F2457D|nr:SgcJ/EcaC family oxidoreductase [Novosphingobium sp. 9U]VWX54634.1 conserved hypothetical protein [Novosphingobium sp. 9U]
MTSEKPLIDPAAATIAEPLVSAFQAAWNTHQLINFDAVFWPDSAFIHRGGELIEGGTAIRDYHVKLHTDPFFASSRISLTIERARRLAPDVVLVTTRSHAWLGPNQAVKVDSRPSFVITRKNTEWRIAFGQNTEDKPAN